MASPIMRFPLSYAMQPTFSSAKASCGDATRKVLTSVYFITNSGPKLCRSTRRHRTPRILCNTCPHFGALLVAFYRARHRLVCAHLPHLPAPTDPTNRDTSGRSHAHTPLCQNVYGHDAPTDRAVSPILSKVDAHSLIILSSECSEKRPHKPSASGSFRTSSADGVL